MYLIGGIRFGSWKVWRLNRALVIFGGELLEFWRFPIYWLEKLQKFRKILHGTKKKNYNKIDFIQENGKLI